MKAFVLILLLHNPSQTPGEMGWGAPGFLFKTAAACEKAKDIAVKDLDDPDIQMKFRGDGVTWAGFACVLVIPGDALLKNDKTSATKEKALKPGEQSIDNMPVPAPPSQVEYK